MIIRTISIVTIVVIMFENVVYATNDAVKVDYCWNSYGSSCEKCYSNYYACISLQVLTVIVCIVTAITRIVTNNILLTVIVT